MRFTLLSSPTSSITLRTVKWVGHLFFVIYLLFAYYYFLERTLPFDGALYSFKMIRFHTFNIENGRWGVVFTQLFPLLAVKAGWSLKAFLMSYSMSFALWNYVFFLILAYFFRNVVLCLAYIFSLILFYRYSFYYPVSEIHSTIGPLFILFAIFDSLFTSIEKNERREMLLLSVLAIITGFWIANIHVIALIPLAFYIVYAIINKKAGFKRYVWFYLIAAATILLYIIIIKMIPSNSYQGKKIFGLPELKFVITDTSSVAGYQFFKTDFFNNYYLNVLFLLITFYFLYRGGHILKGIYVLISLAGFWIIIMAYNIKLDCPLNYQNYYCYLGLLMALPLVEDFFLILKRQWFLACVIILMSFNFYKIIKSGLKFEDRTAYMKRTTDNLRRNYSEKKFAVCERNFDLVTVWSDWDLSFETLFISSLESRDSSITFFTEPNIWKYDDCIHSDPKCFIGIAWSPLWFHTHDINGRYFNIGENLYRKASSMQNDQFPDTVFTKDNIAIGLKDEYKLLRFENRQIELSVQNKTAVNFSSMVTDQKKIWLSYRIYDKNGHLAVSEGNRTPLEIDIPPGATIVNGLSINLKDIVRGAYTLEVDMVHENKRWFGINAKTNLVIR